MDVKRLFVPAMIVGGVVAGGACYYLASEYIANNRRRTSSRPDPTTVLVTENGQKYHRDGCPLLHGRTRRISIIDAIVDYQPCRACHPPASA